MIRTGRYVVLRNKSVIYSSTINNFGKIDFAERKKCLLDTCYVNPAIVSYEENKLREKQNYFTKSNSYVDQSCSSNGICMPMYYINSQSNSILYQTSPVHISSRSLKISPRSVISLRSKVIPTVSNIKNSLRNGLYRFKSKIDMAPYDHHFKPVRVVIFTCLATKRIGIIIGEGIKHMYHSFRLLYLNSKVGYKIAVRILKGENVSVIDRNRLRRALADIFLMLPFSAFIIIPGAELFIPLYVKKFPGGIPRTFESLTQKEQRQIKAAQARIDLATFLHGTMEEMTKKQKVTNSARMIDFMKFAKGVRTGGVWVSNEDFKTYAPLFQDELTIDRMDRKTLDALCKIFKANPVKRGVMGYHGHLTQSTQLIRVLLKRRIHDLKLEDQDWMEIISKHGIKAIPDEDLQELSRDRGMRSLGLTRERLERQYLDWIELSTDPKISDSMLAYTRMLYMPKALDKMGAAMETAIEKKVSKPIKEPEKVVSKTESTIAMEQLRITKEDFDALELAIRNTKMLLKPVASAQDYLGYKTKKLGKEVEQGKKEGIKNGVLKKIEKINTKVQREADKLPVEKADVDVSIKDLLHTELIKCNIDRTKILKVLNIIDQNMDGLISLDEIEMCLERISGRLDEKTGLMDFVEFYNILEQIHGENVSRKTATPSDEFVEKDAPLEKKDKQMYS